MAKVNGICHLCGKNTILTFEHIPPKKANNKDNSKMITGKEIFNVDKMHDGKSLRYIQRQQGAGDYTLCEECNNNTGHWYADEYIKFANEIGYCLNCKTNLETTKTIKLASNKLYFQRIIKQILCMFLSTIQPEYAIECEDIRQYVLNKDNVNFNEKKYRISMFLLRKYENSHSGIINMLINEDGKNYIKTIALMNLYPLGFILEINPQDKELAETTNITKFTTLKYDEIKNVEMLVSITDRYSISKFTKRIIEKNYGLNKKGKDKNE